MDTCSDHGGSYSNKDRGEIDVTEDRELVEYQGAEGRVIDDAYPGDGAGQDVGASQEDQDENEHDARELVAEFPPHKCDGISIVLDMWVLQLDLADKVAGPNGDESDANSHQHTGDHAEGRKGTGETERAQGNGFDDEADCQSLPAQLVVLEFTHGDGTASHLFLELGLLELPVFVCVFQVGLPCSGILKSEREQPEFDSYRAYLWFHNEDATAFSRLCGASRSSTDPGDETIFPNRKPSFQRGSAVLNLSEAGQLSTDEGYCTQDEGDGPRTDMVEALCHPPPDTKIQIAVWDTSNMDDFDGCEAFGDLIGLRYQLDPIVFTAIEASRAPPSYKHQYGLDRFAITHAKIGNVVTIVLRPKDGTHRPLLVLIAGSSRELSPDFRERRIFESCPPFSNSVGGAKKLCPLASLRRGYDFYSKELNRLLSQYHDSKTSVAECTLLCLLPLLHLSLVKVRYSLSVTRDHFGDWELSRSDIPYDDQIELRTLISQLESDWWSMRRYMRSCYKWELSEMRSYQDADNEVKDSVEEASRLEGQVREYLQLQIGIKALEESKKSIEVSNQQIQEGKRMKTFTILALVYVPLNLASSIYGMNIQQLNGSGQSVWIFVVTAVIALLITAGTWYLSEATNTYRRWHRSRAEHDGRLIGDDGIKRPEFSVAERIAMIVWLKREGYGSWMRTTGAWWKILLNRSDPMIVDDYNRSPDWPMSAGDLVSRYSSGELDQVKLKNCRAAKSEATAFPAFLP
ncbi:MAG: hypothetical protein Q9192_006563 [Flavoplaca navasiana]